MDRKFSIVAIVVVIAWSVIIFVRSNAAAKKEADFVDEVCLNQGRAIFQVITDMRSWASGIGGVYVPVGEKTPPNSYLILPRRDVKTSDGQSLTLFNPAYITRQVAEIGLERRGVRFHITALDPVRPENAPASWEKKALGEFSSGAREYHDIVEEEGSYYFRYMAPLFVESSCLTCHTGKDRVVGQNMGGISISFPVDELVQRHSGILRTNRLLFAVLWLVGIFALAGGVILFDKVTHGARKL